MASATRRAFLAAGLALGAPRIGAAQEAYPSRPITMVIPWAAGGSTDTLGRILAQAMAADLGQPVVVENRGGASGTVGHGHVARSRPDGHTILLATNSTYAMAPHLMRSLPYDNRAAFTPVSLVARSPQALSVHPSVPVNSVAELVALAKARPGRLDCSSTGVGTVQHVSLELLNHMAGIRINHVVYREAGAAKN
ncbi:MAG TPA: tripartite tricarboxylate transporter substrate binding protein, partial [Acetobacteraceae bacterium]|nr:tripartite tricarboxylate transporter substrate binding protein [Acetobacteraceae bacterium]